jgi:hypothetical protein
MIAIAISLWMWATYTKEVAHYGTAAEKQARQFAGQDEHGNLAINSVDLTPHVEEGRLKFVMVDSVAPQGAYAKWYRLQANDQIIGAGPMGDFRNQDAEMAHALIQEAYQRQWDLIVIRGGKTIVLPGTGPAVTQANATPTTQPAQAGNEETVIPKELAPLRGVIR